jgi:hypothetical protein
MINWYDKLKIAFKETGDNFDQMETTLSEEGLHKEFDGGYGGTEGEPFTAWGERFVYFPVCYDGAEWVGFAPRNPCHIKTQHIGGG